MLKLKSRLVAAGFLLTLSCLSSVSARAASVSYVSGKGADSGDCALPANPCRTFQYAINQTAPGGDVKALDPADYRPVTINKSISITGVEGAGIDTNGTGAIGIDGFGGPPLTVHLSNLLVQNLGGDRTNSAGISAFPDGLVTVTHCAVRGYGHGIASPIGTTFVIVDTIVTNNGIGINATADGFSTFELNHVTVSGNRVAGVAILSATVTAVDTVADKNGTGFSVGQGSLFLAHSTVVGNGTGIDIRALGLAVSSGDNHIRANGTDVRGGTLTRVGTQ